MMLRRATAATAGIDHGRRATECTGRASRKLHASHVSSCDAVGITLSKHQIRVGWLRARHEGSTCGQGDTVRVARPAAKLVTIATLRQQGPNETERLRGRLVPAR